MEQYTGFEVTATDNKDRIERLTTTFFKRSLSTDG